MLDQYGFPRHTESLAAGGYAGVPWKVFWSLSNISMGAIGITTYACPYPFPGRYFLLGRSNGTPNVTVATVGLRPMPLVRFSATTAATGSYPLNGAFNRDLTLSPLSIEMGPSGAGTAGVCLGYLSYNVVGQLTAVFSVADNVPATTVAQSLATYNNGDIWFYVKVPTSGNLTSFCIEYVDLPL